MDIGFIGPGILGAAVGLAAQDHSALVQAREVMAVAPLVANHPSAPAAP